MARPKSQSSLAAASASDLQKALEIRKQVDQLEAKKAGLKAQLDDVDKAIASLLGGGGSAPKKRRGRKPGPKPGPKPGAKKARKKPGPKPGAKKAAGNKPGPKPKAAKAVKAEKKAPKKAAAGAKRKGKVSVTSLVEELLQAAGKPMKVTQISDVLLNEKGVKTKSKNFYASLTATLQNSPKFQRVDKGIYGLAKGGEKAAPAKKAEKKAKKK